jgi:chromosome partitioning protein
MFDQPIRPYIVAVFNQKGGISKTTTSTNLAACLAAFGKSVVTIDLDAQGDSTKSFGIESDMKQGVYDLLMGQKTLPEVISPTVFENVRIVPSTYSLAGVEIEMSGSKNSQRTLSTILKANPLECDYVVIDCPPALGILPINALAVAHAVIIPVTATPFANDGLMRTLPSIKFVQEGLNRKLLLHGVLFTIVDKFSAGKRINKLIRRRLGNTVYDAEIPRDRAVIDAAAHGLPVCAYAPTSLAARAYLNFTAEFLTRQVSIFAKAGGGARRQEGTEAASALPDVDAAQHNLVAWRNSHSDLVEERRNRFDALTEKSLNHRLYGSDRSLERRRLAVVHFFIDNRLIFLSVLIGIALGALTALAITAQFLLS